MVRGATLAITAAALLGSNPTTFLPLSTSSKYEGNSLLGISPGTWNGVAVAHPFVPHSDDGSRMWFSGADRDGHTVHAQLRDAHDYGLTNAARFEILGGVVTIDTVYTPPDYPDGALAATIFLPPPATANRASVILGRYTDATRLTASVWCDTLAARGYLAMTIDYDNLDVSTYPKPQRAFKTAVEFLRSNADRFGIDPEKIVGFGQSQGALIWGQTIPWDNDDVFFGTDPDVDDHLNAAVLLYGAYDMFNYLLPIQRSILEAHFSPDPLLRGTKGQAISNASRVTAPVLLIHGSADEIVDVQHSRRFYDSLRTYSDESHLLEIAGARHVFDLDSQDRFTPSGLVAKDSMLAFLNEFVPSTKQRGFEIPAAHHLSQNYPNPFSGSTTITFELARPALATLKVFNVLGQEVASLIAKYLPAGNHSIKWHADGHPDGTYFYRLDADGITATRALSLMR